MAHPRLRYCGITSCVNNRGIRDDRIQMFKASTHAATLKWIEALDKVGLPYANHKPYVCILHFHPNDLVFTCRKKRRMKPRSGAVPSLKSRSLTSIFSSDAEDMDIKPIEMEPADEQIHMESIVEIESEPMDDMFAEPITHKIPFITYSNRKKYIRNTATTRLSIKIEKPDEMTDVIETIESHSHQQNQNSFQSINNCIQRNDLKMDESQLITQNGVDPKNGLNLKGHIKKGHEPTSDTPKGPFFECYICKCQLQSLVCTLGHMKHHTTAIKTKCSICGVLHSSGKLLKRHICGGEICEISCEYCGQSFRSVAKCQQHLESAHMDRTIYFCQKYRCTRYFEMTELKNLHEKYYKHYYNISISKAFSQHMKQSHSNVANSIDSWLCSECGKSYPTKNRLQNHSILHTEPKFKCPKCPAMFHYKQVFTRHYQLHQNIKYRCNECNSSYSTTKRLYTHVKRVHRNVAVLKNFKCPICDFKCSRSDKLKNHIRKHTGEKSFQCEICPSRFFRYKDSLRTHMQVHVGNDTYKCDVCGQGFRYHAEFKRHSFVHYNEKKENEVDAAQSFSNAIDTK